MKSNFENDCFILEKSLNILSLAFNDFLNECLEDGKPKLPTMRAISKARAYLPPYCSLSYKKETK